MDVVLATPEYWTVDPFSGVVQDGYVWGRGALDMKGEAIAQLMTLLTLKRAGVPLKRDVIFLATADEEIGGGVGAGWFVEHHRDDVQDAEFLLNEGGTVRTDPSGRIEYYGVGTTEKSPFWLNLTARGTPGHGSRPTPDNPVHRLVRALSRIGAYQTPLVVTPAVERYFRDLSTIETDQGRRAALADVRAALRDSAAVRFLTGDLTYNALLRNTISITGLQGSDKTNVIPPVARAALDVRLLPGQDPQAFLADVVRIVGDSAVEITPQGPNWPATESPTETELFRAIVAAARERTPDARVTKRPLGWLAERLARPLIRWDRARLETPDIAVPVAGLPPGLVGYRLALVTDLHHGPAVPTWWLGRMADRVRELDTDLVVLGGDFVSHARSDVDGLEGVLARFRGRDGVVAVLGNHDHWVDPDQVGAAVERSGATLLHNRHRLIRRGAAVLAGGGVDDLTHRAGRPHEAFAGGGAGVPRGASSPKSGP